MVIRCPDIPGWRGAIKRGQGAAEIAGELNVTIVFFGVAIATPPMLCTMRRTAISGLVSLPRTRLITALRCAGVKTSMG